MMLYKVESNRIVALDQNNQEAGEMVWSTVDKQTIQVDHTLVNEAYRGQGIAQQLMTEMVAHGRSQQLKVIPVCPFVKKQFAINEEYQDILAK